MPQFTIKCRVTLNGAIMTVDAETAEDAKIKAKSGDWDDIDWADAELTDWELRGTPKKEE